MQSKYHAVRDFNYHINILRRQPWRSIRLGAISCKILRHAAKSRSGRPGKSVRPGHYWTGILSSKYGRSIDFPRFSLRLPTPTRDSIPSVSKLNPCCSRDAGITRPSGRVRPPRLPRKFHAGDSVGSDCVRMSADIDRFIRLPSKSGKFGSVRLTLNVSRMVEIYVIRTINNFSGLILLFGNRVKFADTRMPSSTRCCGRRRSWRPAPPA